MLLLSSRRKFQNLPTLVTLIPNCRLDKNIRSHKLHSSRQLMRREVRASMSRIQPPRCRCPWSFRSHVANGQRNRSRTCSKAKWLSLPISFSTSNRLTSTEVESADTAKTQNSATGRKNLDMRATRSSRINKFSLADMSVLEQTRSAKIRKNSTLSRRTQASLLTKTSPMVATALNSSQPRAMATLGTTN